MRCSTVGLYLFDVEPREGYAFDSDKYGNGPMVQLCLKHHEQAKAYAAENPTEDAPETVQDPNAPMIDTGLNGPIYSLDGGHHWFEGTPPTAQDVVGTVESFPEPNATTVVAEPEPAPATSPAEFEDVYGTKSDPYVELPPAVPIEVVTPNPLATLADTFAGSSKVLAESPVIAELPALATYYGGLAEGADDFTISTQEELTAVGEAATKLATDLSRVDTTRTDITKPINAFKRGVDAAFAGALAPMKKVDAAFRREMRAYNNAQLAAAPALMAEGKHEEALAVAPPVMAAGISAAVTWGWELTDPSLVPAEFLTVDTAKVAAQVRLLKGQCSIPGIRVYPDTQIRVAKS